MLRNRKDREDPLSAATERPHSTTIIVNNEYGKFLLSKLLKVG